MVQKELKILAKNTRLKKVYFENSTLPIKIEKQLIVNYTQMVKSTYYSTSFKELSLIKM